MSRKVTFKVTTGFVGSEREETIELESLGIIESQYESEEELNRDIDDAFQEWLWNNIDTNWYIED